MRHKIKHTSKMLFPNMGIKKYNIKSIWMKVIKLLSSILPHMHFALVPPHWKEIGKTKSARMYGPTHMSAKCRDICRHERTHVQRNL